MARLILDLGVSGDPATGESVRSCLGKVNTMTDEIYPAMTGNVDVSRIGSGTKDTTTFYRGDGTFAVPSGGGGAPATILSDPFDTLNAALWTPESIPFPTGRDAMYAEGVSVAGGELLLTTPAGTYKGATLKSVNDYGYGSYRVVMKAPDAPGAYATVFSYKETTGVAAPHGEIDVEIKCDASRIVLINTYKEGVEVTNAYVLPFDPRADYHEYRYDYRQDSIEWYADGQLIWRLEQNVPAVNMRLLFSLWWPNSFSPAPLPTMDKVARYKSVEVKPNVDEGYRRHAPTHYPAWVVGKAASFDADPFDIALAGGQPYQILQTVGDGAVTVSRGIYGMVRLAGTITADKNVTLANPQDAKYKGLICRVEHIAEMAAGATWKVNVLDPVYGNRGVLGQYTGKNFIYNGDSWSALMPG